MQRNDSTASHTGRSPGTHPTWKPEQAAAPLKTKALFVLRKVRRARMITKRMKKHGKNYRRGFEGPKLHGGPCVATKILTYDPGLFARVFKGAKKKYRTIAGKGHRILSFDKFGNSMWHPRYADVKICGVCRKAWNRAPKQGAA